MSLPDDLNMTDAQLIKLCRFQAAALEAKDAEIKQLTGLRDALEDALNAKTSELYPGLRADIAKLQNSVDLLCAAIADDSLGRVALQTVARNIKHPIGPTTEIIEWAQKIIRERAPLEKDSHHV